MDTLGRNFKSTYVETLRDKIESERNLITYMMSGDEGENCKEIDRLTVEIGHKFYEIEKLLNEIDRLI